MALISKEDGDDVWKSCLAGGSMMMRYTGRKQLRYVLGRGGVCSSTRPVHISGIEVYTKQAGTTAVSVKCVAAKD